MVRYYTKFGVEKAYTIPNFGPIPEIGIEEGLPDGPLPIHCLEPSRQNSLHWSDDLQPWERLHTHATMSSARRHVFCKRPFAPKDELDFLLASSFQPLKELFPEKMDICMQQEIKLGDDMNLDIKEKLLKQQVYYKPSQRYIKKRTEGCHSETTDTSKSETGTWRIFRNRKIITPQKSFPRDHPIQYGGITEKRNIYNVKLGIPADHTARTNPGFSRTPSGSYFAV